MKPKIKILQIAPNVLNLNENLTYGGIERVIMALSKEFTKTGYENHIVAPAGDNTFNNILFSLPEAYWTSINRDPKFKTAANAVFSNIAHISKSINQINQSDADIVHDHSGKLFPFKEVINKPLLTTLHGPSDWFWDGELYSELFKGCFFSAVSDFQKKDHNFLNIDYVVYNGLDLASFPFNPNAGEYLFSLGQIARYKGQHIAIDVAKRTGNKLIIGGNVSDDPTDTEDRIYFETEIKPHLKTGQIEYVGELNDSQKKVYYKNAKAFLMPISCNEAFGLVMIESMACGTPVIAFNKGAVPEIV